MPESVKQSEKSVESGKILICDEQRECAVLIQAVLTNEGYLVELVADRCTAENLLTTKNYDVVIVSLSLPDSLGPDPVGSELVGLAVLKKVKEIHPETEVILMGTEFTHFAACEALHWQAAEFLLKPIRQMKAIVNLLSKLMQKKQLRKKNQELMTSFRRKVNELSVLYEMSRALSYSLDYDKLFQLIVDALGHALHFDVFAAFLLKDRGPGAELLVHHAHHIPARSVRFVKELVHAAFQAMSGAPVELEKIATSIKKINSKRVPSFDAQQTKTLASHFNVPLILEDEPIGLIFVGAFQENAFTNHDVKLLFSIANQLAETIKGMRRFVLEDRSKLKSMVGPMHEGVIMSNKQGEIIFINPRAADLLNLNPETGTTTEVLKHYFESLGIFSLTFGVLDEAIFYDLGPSIEVNTIDRSLRVFEVSQHMVTTDGGERIGIVTTIRDITERKRLEEMKDTFLSTVSHELRTPLTIIKGAIGNLSDGIVGELSESQAKILDIAQTNVQRLSRLINDLLDLSRLESGRLLVKFMKLDAVKMLEELLSVFSSSAVKKNIQITLDVEPSLPDIFGDPDMISQVFSSLMSNALRHTTSSICIQVRRLSPAVCNQSAPDGTINLASQSTLPEINQEIMHLLMKQHIEFSIIDDGNGIPEERRSELFNKFVQINRPMGGAGYKGTGLGLSICREIVEKHYGQIYEEKAPSGTGSKFVFTIPQYHPQIDFWIYLKQGLQQIQKNRKAVLYYLTISNYHELLQYSDELSLQNKIQDLEKLLQDKIIRQTDRAFYLGAGEYFLVFNNVDKRGVEAIKKRIQDTVFLIEMKSLDEQGRIQCALGSAIYPDDGIYGDKLIQVACQIERQAQSNKTKVLLIDDEGELLQVLTVMLQAEGYLVDVAMDGSAGLKKIHSFKPDIVLMDLVMPKMDGMQVLKQLRLNDESKDIPVIIISANDQLWSREEFAKLGVSKILRKPFNHEQLLKILKSLVVTEDLSSVSLNS